MGVLVSTLIYILTYALSALCLHISKKSKRRFIDIFFVVAILLPVLLAAFRVNTGTDYANYVSIYETNKSLSFNEWFVSNRALDDTRIGIWLLCRVAAVFGSSKIFFGLIALIIYCPVAAFIKNNYKDVTFLAAFIFLMTLFTSGLNISKQVLAASILFCGINFIKRRNFFRYILVVLLAMCFHVTAIVGIIAYFLDGKTKSGSIFGKVSTLIVVCLVLIFLPQIMKLLGGRFEGYIDYGGVIRNRSILIDLTLLIIFFLLRKHYLRLSKHNDLFIYMFLLGVIFEFTGFVSPYIKRIASYFIMAQVLLFAQLPLLFIKNERKLVSVVVFIYTAALFVVTNSILGQADIVPYHTDFAMGIVMLLTAEIIGLTLFGIVKLIDKKHKFVLPESRRFDECEADGEIK